MGQTMQKQLYFQCNKLGNLRSSSNPLQPRVKRWATKAESRSGHGNATFAGDIGDTKTDLVLDSREFWPHTPLAPTEVCGADYASLQETIEEFLAEVQTSIDVASCDVAGPGINGRVKITDLLWAHMKPHSQPT